MFRVQELVHLKGIIIIVIFIIHTVHSETPEATQLQCPGDENTNAKEKDLIRCLLNDDEYEPLARPVKMSNETVNVKMTVATIKIEDIDEKNQMLRMRGWILQQWKDPHFTWNASHYDNVQQLRIPINRIWSPDTIIYNYAEEVSLRDESHSNAVIGNDGTVYYSPIQTNIKSSCQLNLRAFPYDEQVCWLAIGPASNPVDRINISSVNISKTWYEGHEWEVMKADTQRIEHVFDGTDIFGTKVIMSLALYSIHLKRNPVYYQHIFVIPTVMLVVVTLLVFLVPPQANERLTLCGAVLIAITLLILMIENHLPTEVAEAPLLLRFLLYTLFVNTVAMVTTVTSLNCYHRDIKKAKVPNWVRKIFLNKLSRYICLRVSVYESLHTQDESVFDVNTNELHNTGTSLANEDRELFEDSPLPKSPTLSIEKTMDEIRRYLRILAARPNVSESRHLSHRQIVVNEWHQVALVIDRLVFIWFTVMTIFIAVVMSLV